jgi:hypothetical protein
LREFTSLESWTFAGSLQFGFEVLADLPHDLFAAAQHGVVQGLAAVLGDENQVDVQVVDDVPAGADVGFGLQRGDTPL